VTEYGMELEYICRVYGVPAVIGRRVEVAGRPGVIAADHGAYIGVLFDDEPPNRIRPHHPTSDGLVYLGEMGRVRQMTRSQKRYRRFLEFGDRFDSFLDFCRWDAEPERSWNTQQ